MSSHSIARVQRFTEILSTSILDHRPSIAYVAGWLGKQNLGDEALLAAYRILFPSCSLLPYDGGRCVRGLAEHRFFRAGILAGGTLIGEQKSTVATVNRFLDSGLPLAVFGTGVETQLFWPGEDTLPEWRSVLARAEYVGVRGPISAQMLEASGVKHVHVVGDPVIAFSVTELGESPEPCALGLNIGVTDGRLWGGSECKVRDEVAALAVKARVAGWKVKWFVIWPKDLEVTRQAALMSGTDVVIEIYRDHLAFIRESRLLTAFVGMKLHATILATCALTPSIMLEYRPKCRDYMQSIGFGDYTIRTDALCAGLLWDRIRDMTGKRGEIIRKLRSNIGALRRRQQAHADRVSKLLLE